MTTNNSANHDSTIMLSSIKSTKQSQTINNNENKESMQKKLHKYKLKVHKLKNIIENANISINGGHKNNYVKTSFKPYVDKIVNYLTSDQN